MGGMTAPDLALVGCLAAGPLAGWAAARATRLFAPDIARPPGLELALAAACTALFAWAWAITPPGLVLAASLLLAWCLLVLAATDIAVLRLPDAVTLPLAAAGLVMAWRLPAADGLLAHVAGALAGYAALAAIAWGFRRLRGVEGIGMGDAKLMAAAGAWLGWRALPGVLILGCLGGLLWWSLARGLSRAPEGSARIPFGAPLCAAIWLTWLYGQLQFTP